MLYVALHGAGAEKLGEIVIIIIKCCLFFEMPLQIESNSPTIDDNSTRFFLGGLI